MLGYSYSLLRMLYNVDLTRHNYLKQCQEIILKKYFIDALEDYFCSEQAFVKRVEIELVEAVVRRCSSK